VQYCLKLSSTTQNPAYSGVFVSQCKSSFDFKPNQIQDDTSPEIFRSKFYEVCEDYTNFCQIYTDGSKMVKEWPWPVLPEIFPNVFGYQIIQASSELNYLPSHCML